MHVYDVYDANEYPPPHLLSPKNSSPLRPLKQTMRYRHLCIFGRHRRRTHQQRRAEQRRSAHHHVALMPKAPTAAVQSIRTLGFGWKGNVKSRNKCQHYHTLSRVHEALVEVMDPGLVTMNCMVNVRKLKGMYHHIMRKFP